MKVIEQESKIIIPNSYYDLSSYISSEQKGFKNDPEGATEEEFNTWYSAQRYFKDQMKIIEKAGRTAYKSEEKITEDSYKSFIKGIVNRKHFAVIEFGDMTVHFVTDRGISHEAVRMRLCSFLQESTRYCNYNNDKFGSEITVIKPNGISEKSAAYDNWYNSCKQAEDHYLAMIHNGVSPQNARSVLPTCVKTELMMKANFREWRHIFELRVLGTTGAPHPDMKALMLPLYDMCRNLAPEIFDLGDVE